MKKALLIGAAVLAVPAIVFAEKVPKVFVCKYVGTPGVDERLQTGQNPIDVSENAIKDFKGVGSYFNDAQGRSYVLAVDIGQPEPNVSECPAPQTPPVTPPQPPTTPPTTETPPNTTTTSTNDSTPSTEAQNFVGK